MNPALSERRPRRPAERPVTPKVSVPVESDRWKRVVDFPFAAVLFVLLAPVMLLTMLVVKMTSRGPALYTQTRVGRGGKNFVIYKIRTMSHDCESLTGPRWAMPGDPRVTSVGRVLRALHLDELPQLWNVLRGDMAMIGPRPERPEICSRLRSIIKNYDLRHGVKPGITGFAQVHLPPDSCIRSVRNKIAYDRFYIRHRGPLFDLVIYLCTAFKVMGLRFLYERKPRKPVDA